MIKLGTVPITVNSRNLNSHHFNLRVSNPRTTAYLRCKMPFEGPNLLGPGRTSKYELVKTDRAFLMNC